MDKKLLIGLGGVAAAGVIAGGIYFATSGNDFAFLKQEGAEERERQENAEKIEALYLDELKDSDRYSFCAGSESITGTYRNTVVMQEEGEVKYSSTDLSLLDKESNKLYLLGRTINYQYQGEGSSDSGIGAGLIKTEEGGQLTEYYKKSEAPVRLDYPSGILFPAPDRGSKDWVIIKTKLIGTMMGVTQETEETSEGDAKTFCLPIDLKNNSSAAGFSASQEQIAYDGNCAAPEVTPGVSFSGRYKYRCDFVDYEQGVELLENYKTKQALPQPGDISDESTETIVDTATGPGVPEETEPDDTPSLEEINRRMEDMRRENQADQSAR